MFKELKQEEKTTGKVEKLGHRGSRLKYLTSVLHTQEPVLVADAAFELGCLGKQGQSALPDLIQIAYSPHHKVRANAIAAIGRIAEDADSCLPLLFQSLADEVPLVRQYAAAGIGMFSSTDLKRMNAEEELNHYLDDHDPCVRVFVNEIMDSFKK